jgi:hypothetical protein
MSSFQRRLESFDMEHRAKTTLSFLSKKDGLKPVFNAFYEKMLEQKPPEGGMSKFFFDDEVGTKCLADVVTSGQLDDFWKFISTFSERGIANCKDSCRASRNAVIQHANGVK